MIRRQKLRVFYFSRMTGVDYFTPFPKLLAIIIRVISPVCYMYITELGSSKKTYIWRHKIYDQLDDN